MGRDSTSSKTTNTDEQWFIRLGGESGKDEIDLHLKSDALCIDLPAFVDVFMTLEGVVLISQALDPEKHKRLKASIDSIIDVKAAELAGVRQMINYIDQIVNQKQESQSDYIAPSQVFASTQRKG